MDPTLLPSSAFNRPHPRAIVRYMITHGWTVTHRDDYCTALTNPGFVGRLTVSRDPYSVCNTTTIQFLGLEYHRPAMDIVKEITEEWDAFIAEHNAKYDEELKQDENRTSMGAEDRLRP